MKITQTQISKLSAIEDIWKYQPNEMAARMDEIFKNGQSEILISFCDNISGEETMSCVVKTPNAYIILEK